MTPDQVIERFRELKGRSDHLQEDLTRTSKEINRLEKHRDHAEQARVILQEVGQKTQEQLSYHLTELVDLAMAAILPDPYKLHLSFELARARTAVEIAITKGDAEDRIDPMTEAGGGVVDIVSFALRISLWALSRPRPRGTLILDEPFRFLSRGLQPRASTMLEELSRRLGIQFVVISHEDELVQEADRIIEVKQVRGVSQCSL